MNRHTPKVIAIAVGVVLLSCAACVVGALLFSADELASTDLSATLHATPPTHTPKPTAIIKPSATPPPTRTPKPTRTPRSTAAPTEVKPPTLTPAPQLRPLLGAIWSGVTVYDQNGSELFAILGGSDACTTLKAGVYVQYPTGSKEWKDRSYLVTSGLFYALSDDPAIRNLAWYEYPGCP